MDRRNIDLDRLPGLVPEVAVAAFPCPRCKLPLIDPDGLGWCKACGYCRSLEEGEQHAGKQEETPRPNQLTATGDAIGQTPRWVWITLAGIVLVTLAALAGGRYLTLSPFARAALSGGSIVVGVALMFIGQLIALVKIAPEDSSVTILDAVFPFRLYGLILKRLPNTSFAIYLAAWSLAAIMATNIFIGGIGHWLTYLPGGPNSPQKTRSTK